MATVEFTVFGVGSYLDITVSTMALTGVVGFTVIFEIATHRLEAHLEGTPYMGMLAKIYKGVLLDCFCRVVLYNTSHLVLGSSQPRIRSKTTSTLSSRSKLLECCRSRGCYRP